MRLPILLTATMLVGAISAAPASAACRIDTQSTFETQLERVNSAEARDDLKTLRNAAQILKRNDKDEACGVVVEAMTELRTTFTRTAARSDAAGTPERQQRQAQSDTRERTRTDAATTDRRAAVTAAPVRMRASQLIGADLIGPNGDEVAEIEDLVLNKDGADYAIVSFGGFLGMGDDQAAVPVSHIQAQREAGDADDVVFKLPMTVAQLKKAPRFKKDSQAWFGDNDWWSNNDNYYSGISSTQE